MQEEGGENATLRQKFRGKDYTFGYTIEYNDPCAAQLLGAKSVYNVKNAKRKIPT